MQLTELEHGVNTVGQAAYTIHEELIEQDRMLDQVRAEAVAPISTAFLHLMNY